MEDTTRRRLRPKSEAKSANGGEIAILRQVRERAAGMRVRDVRLGIGDDCAILRVRPAEELTVTTDLTVCGTHFRLDWHTPEQAGHRTLARGLSDLAAMGARPVAAFLSLGLPRELARPQERGPWSKTWVARFIDGLLTLAAGYKTPLAGGDLSETPVPLADIVLLGAVPAGKALLRSGAKPGDLIYVTGQIGGGAAALPHLDRLARTTGAKALGLNPRRMPKGLAALLARHLAPQPRIAQGLYLRQRDLVSAAMDLSDGLSTDLTHLCEESRVAAEIDAALLPVYPGASLDYALHGGDDYELLFTARPEVRMPAKIRGVAVTRIGRVLQAQRRRPRVTVLGTNGPEPLTPRGWEHFS